MMRRIFKHQGGWYVTVVTAVALCAGSSVRAQTAPNGANGNAGAPQGYYAPVQPQPPRPLPPTAQNANFAAPRVATNPAPGQAMPAPQMLPNGSVPNGSGPNAQPRWVDPAVQRASYEAALTQPGQGAKGPGMGRDELPLPNYAQTPTAGVRPEFTWSLQQAEETSLQFNPVLRHALAQIDSARGDAQQASLYPNPRFDTNNPEVFAGQNSSYNAGFMQDIVVKGKLRLDRAAAEEVVRQREHGLTVNRFTLLTAVRQQFYTVLASQRRIELLDQLRIIAAETVRAAQGRVDAGEGTISEVYLLQTELQKAEIALRNAQTVLDAERRQLAAIIGRPDLRIDRVSGDLTSGFPDYDPDNLRIFVVSSNAQVQVARREIDRQQILLRRARVEPYPNVRVGPTYNSNLTPVPGTSQFWFTVQFDIPVWNRNQGNIRSTQGDLADSIASLGMLQNNLLGQVEDVLGRYRAARQLEERIRTQILPTARRALELVRDGYQKGILDISTLLQAQRTLSETSVSYNEALESVWTTAAEIANLLQLERFP